MARLNKLVDFAAAAAEVKTEKEHEKVLLNGPLINTDVEQQDVFIVVTAFATTPAEAEELTVRIRRTGLEGTEVVKQAMVLGAFAHGQVVVIGHDEPGEVAGFKYVVTAQEKKATVEDTLINLRMVVLH